jgi:hypothetical protein
MNEEEIYTDVHTERGTDARRVTRDTREFETRALETYDSEEIVFMSNSEDLRDDENLSDDEEEDSYSEDKMTRDNDSVKSAKGSSSRVPKFKRTVNGYA